MGTRRLLAETDDTQQDQQDNDTQQNQQDQQQDLQRLHILVAEDSSVRVDLDEECFFSFFSVFSRNFGIFL